MPISYSAPHPHWAWYSNTRYQYAVRYPNYLLHGQGEAGDGDGERFTSADGRASLTVYAGYNVFHQTLMGLYQEAARHPQLGDRVRRKDGYAVRWQDAGMIH